MTVRRIATIVSLLALLVGALPTLAFAANADMEGQFIKLVNAERTSRGLPALSVASDLREVARQHSAEMASNGSLYHNQNLGRDVDNWQKVGENVGRGPSVDPIHDAFMDSSGHRQNILDSDWVELGIGVVVEGNTVWVTEVFRKPEHQASKPAPKPAPKPEPKPEPEAESAPAPKSEPKPAVKDDAAGTRTVSTASKDKKASTSAAKPSATGAATKAAVSGHDDIVVDHTLAAMARVEAARLDLSIDQVLN